MSELYHHCYLLKHEHLVIHDKNGIEIVFVSERGYKAMMDEEKEN